MSTWSRIKKLFWNAPASQSSRKPVGIFIAEDTPRYVVAGNVVNPIGSISFAMPCGALLSWVGGEASFFYCGKPSCPECNPMTPERAAQINERFLKERPLVRVEALIEKDCFIRAITEVQRDKYLVIVRLLDKARSTSAYAIASQLKEPCTFVRHRLQAMEKLGYVAFDSNGPDSIYWSLCK